MRQRLSGRPLSLPAAGAREPVPLIEATPSLADGATETRRSAKVRTPCLAPQPPSQGPRSLGRPSSAANADRRGLAVSKAACRASGGAYIPSAKRGPGRKYSETEASQDATSASDNLAGGKIFARRGRLEAEPRRAAFPSRIDSAAQRHIQTNRSDRLSIRSALYNACQSAAAMGLGTIRQTAATTKGSENAAAEQRTPRRSESTAVRGQQHWLVRGL